jgi:long-chain fatty acid transport protein
MKIKRSSLSSVASLIALVLGGEALAAGFAVEHQNAQAMGAAYAGAEARRGDSGYAVYNPAALAGVERLEVSSNATILFGRTGYENASATLLGAFPAGGLSSDNGVLPVAFVAGSAIAAPVTDRLTLGLTLTTPFGLKSEYAAGSAVRYHAQNASLLTIAVSPTAAFELTDAVSIGASFKVQYMDLTASTVVDAGGVAFVSAVPGFLPGSSDLFAEFKGDDIALGFTAGLVADIAKGVTIGFSYASKVEHDYDGEITFERSGSPAALVLNSVSGLFSDAGFVSTLTTPASFSAGLTAAVSDRLTLLMSGKLMRWSVFDEISFVFDNPVQPPELITAEWTDSFSVAVGADYQYSDRLALRAGFAFDETPVDDRYAGPRIPDEDRRWLTIGATRAVTDRLSVDLAAGHVIAPKTREVRLDGLAPGDALRGALNADVKINTFAVAVRLRYGF